MRAVIYWGLASGLVIEAWFAWRRHRMLPERSLLFVVLIGGLGLLNIASESFSSRADTNLRSAGFAAILGFTVCIGIDALNRMREDRARS